MKKWFVLLLLLCLVLAGCDSEQPQETRPPDVEPTATYDWMAGESPVPTRRIGVYRYGENHTVQAAGPAGTYFVYAPLFIDHTMPDGQGANYILYADHGSDTVVKLCGRVDCAHNNPDCNAYVRECVCMSYENGHLYAVSGLYNDGGLKGDCQLIRMDPDGSNHEVVLDLLSAAEACGAETVGNAMITDGVLFMDLYTWKVTVSGQQTRVEPVWFGSYYYKLDGSMEIPQPCENVAYTCGDVFISFGDAREGDGSGYYSWDPDTNEVTYLTDHPGVPGYFDEDEGYYFRDGFIWRKTYSDQKETALVDTGLEGDYILYAFPDCLMVVSRDREMPEPRFYIYDWAFELVDTVEIDYEYRCTTADLLLAETAERFILTTAYHGVPKYYINKSELGTGNVKLHSFELVGDIKD